MWDCLVKLSTWAEGNSGQIQIVIAVVALIYAWKAYHKVLEQIKISNIQTENSNSQSVYNSRINTLELINVNIEKILNIILSLTRIKKKLEIVYARYENSEIKEIEKIEEQLSEIEIVLNKSNKIKERLDQKLIDICNPNGELIEELLMDLFKQVADANTVLHHCELIEPVLEKYINTFE